MLHSLNSHRRHIEKNNDQHNYCLGNQVYLLVIFKLFEDISAQIRMTIQGEKCSST